MQPNPAASRPQTMGAVLIPLHGVCIPCHAQWRTMLRRCLGDWHLDNCGVPGRRWACVLCTAVHGICIWGIKEMSNGLNNKPPERRDPRQEPRCGHPSKTLEPGMWRSGRQPRHMPTFLCHPPLSVLCLLCWTWQLLPGEGYSISASLHTHTHIHMHRQWPQKPPSV